MTRIGAAKDEKLEFRCTKEEKKKIMAALQSENFSGTLSDFLRQRIVDEKSENEIFLQETLKKISHDLDWELSKIGTNINQIAKICNTQNFVETSDLQNLNREIQEMKNLLQSVLGRLEEVKTDIWP